MCSVWKKVESKLLESSRRNLPETEKLIHFRLDEFAQKNFLPFPFLNYPWSHTKCKNTRLISKN